MSLPYWFGNWRLKLRTFSRARQRVCNWREAVALRLHSGREEVRILRLRDGTQVACRGGNLDWAAFSNLVLLGGCGAGLDYLQKLAGQPLVLDLGANIGLFSVLAARAHPQAAVVAYEPAPPNLRILEINRLLNHSMTDRIQAVGEAVGGRTRKCDFTYDEEQPEASGLLHRKGRPYQVMVRSFADVVSTLTAPVAFAKIDIEGAEFELIEQTPKTVWEQVRAMTIEIHSDDPGKIDGFLQRMRTYGYQVVPEWIGEKAYFLQRGGAS